MSITTQFPVQYYSGPKIHMLASVKEGLYHPCLPTFRRMDMDTAAHKLPEEHSRNTTPLLHGKIMQNENLVLQKYFILLFLTYIASL